MKLDPNTETGGGFPAQIDEVDICRATPRRGLESRIALADTNELIASAAWGRGLHADGDGISGTVIGLFDFSTPDAEEPPDFFEALLGASWVDNGVHAALRMGATVLADGGNASLFGRLVVSK